MSQNYQQLGSSTTTSSNPFYSYDDDDDVEGSTEEIRQIHAKIKRSERQQGESLSRVQRVINETEEIGTHTMEELHHQGEQLDKTEERLDSIAAMTKVTQTHLTSIKSVFGALKNKMFGRKTDSTPQVDKTDIQHSRLREPNDYTSSKSETNRQMGGASYSGSGSSSSSTTNYSKYKNEEDSEEEGFDMLRDVSVKSSRQTAVDEQLGDISTGLHRLKQLGLGMNEELNRQDGVLDRLTKKTETSGMVLEGQNAQMRKLLH